MKLDVKALNLQQAETLKTALEAYDQKSPFSSPSPPVLYIELTQNCLSRCTFCKRWWTNKPSYVMSQELFNLLLKEYIPYASLVDLRGWGESLMLSDFDEYVRKVSVLGPKIRLTTTLGCGNRKAIQSLIDHDVFVSVSFDCAEARLYESIRRGLSFDTVKRNIAFLTHAMARKGTLRENIRLAVMPLQNSNLDHLEGVISFASHYGISEVVIEGLSARSYHLGLLKYHKKRTLQVLQRAAEFAEKQGVQLRLASAPFDALSIHERAFDCCCHPWLYLFVNYKGNAIVCDHLMRPSCEHYALGSIRQDKNLLWNGPKAQALREAHRDKTNRLLPWMCKSQCYGLGRYADHEHEIDTRFFKWLVSGQELLKHINKPKKGKDLK